jgi:hypothetical protein
MFYSLFLALSLFLSFSHSLFLFFSHSLIVFFSYTNLCSASVLETRVRFPGSHQEPFYQAHIKCSWAKDGKERGCAYTNYLLRGMRGAFVWCFVGSVLAQAARACARCCRRSVLCGLLVI